MITQNTNNSDVVVKAVDPLAHDFVVATLVVSVLLNLTVFVSWLVVIMA